MVSVVISEGIILIASVVVAAGLSGMVINKMGMFQSALSASTESHKEIILTKLKVIYASNSSSTTVNIWIKNIGRAPIADLSSVDVYFGKLNSVQRIPHNAGSAPKWIYQNNTDQLWQVGETIQIDVTLDTELQKSTTYAVRIAAPNGVSDDYIFSV